MREDLTLCSFPRWHCWSVKGSVRRLGDPIRRKHRQWIHGGEYTKREISGFVWTDRPRIRASWESLNDDAVFVCSLGPSTATFRLVHVDADPLVDAGAAQAAVFELRSKGLSLRGIAQASGVSYDAIGRLSAGEARRRIRASTEEAVLGLAESANGKPA